MKQSEQFRVSFTSSTTEMCELVAGPIGEGSLRLAQVDKPCILIVSDHAWSRLERIGYLRHVSKQTGKFVLVSPPDNVLEVTRHQHHVLRCELIVGVPPDWRRLASPGAPDDVARRGFDSTVVRVPSSPQTIHPR
jgi:hypothetical protein